MPGILLIQENKGKKAQFVTAKTSKDKWGMDI